MCPGRPVLWTGRMIRTRTRTRARRPLATVAVVLAALVVLVGCGAVRTPGTTASEERDVPAGVTAIRLEGTGHLTLTTGDEPHLTVTAGQNTLDDLTVEEHDGVLVLGQRGRFGLVRNVGPIDWELTLPEVTGIEVEGTGDVDGDLVPVDTFEVTVEGTGHVRLGEVDVRRLDVDLQGTGSVTLTGHADEQHVLVSGTGSYAGRHLTSITADVHVDGTGDADVEVTDTLRAEVDGIGTITHGPGTAHVSSSVDGLGNVRER